MRRRIPLSEREDYDVLGEFRGDEDLTDDTEFFSNRGRVARSAGATLALMVLTAIAFAAGLDTALDQVILIFFALCGLSRLARYNVSAEALAAPSGKVEYFEGTPIPTSVVPLGILILAFHHDRLYPVNVFGAGLHLPVLLFLVSGCLMVSKTLRIPKL